MGPAGGYESSILNFGASVGSADNAPAIRQALATGRAFIPPGDFISSPVAVPPGAVLWGVNGQEYVNATPAIANPNSLSRLKLKAGSTGPLLYPDDTAQRATSVRIWDLALDGTGNAQPLVSLPDQATSISRFWRLTRVYGSNVGGSSGYAVYIGNQNSACVMRDCVIFNGTSGSPAGANGVGWYGSDGLMDNCFVGYFSSSGVVVLGGASDTTFTMRSGGSFTNTTGIVIGAVGAVIDGVSVDHNLNDGIYVGFGTFISHSTFHSNSRAANNTWSNITVDASVNVAVSNCRWAPLDADAGPNLAKYMIDTRGHAGAVVAEFGNFADAGVAFGTGWSS